MTTSISPTHTLSSSAGTRLTEGYFHALKYLREALFQAGMEQTLDTGQMDFTVADGGTTNPVGLTASVLSPFFIMRLNDPLQQSKPFFIKLRLFAPSGNSNVMGLHIQMGSGTDGAGNLTGAQGSLTTGCYLNAASGAGGWTNSNSQRSTYGSGNGSEIVVSMHEAPNTFDESILLTIERTRNDAGAYDGEGVLVQVLYTTSQTWVGSTPAYHAVFPTNGATHPLGYGFMRGLVIPRVVPDRYTFVTGNDFGPLVPFGGGFFPKFRQTHVLYAFPHADMVNYGNEFTMPIYGVNRNFRNIGYQYSQYNSWQHHGGSNGGSSVELQRYSLAMMWE